MSESPRPRSVPRQEIAKMVRAQLAKNFPGVKFSVRGKSYAGGSSVDVSWVDGPIWSAVDAVISPFSGNGFDGMIDGSYVKQPWYCPEHGARVAEVYGHGQGLDGPVKSRCCAKAELISSGAGYVQGHREVSRELRAFVEIKVAKMVGQEYDANVRVWGQWMSDLVNRELNQLSAPSVAQVEQAAAKLPAPMVAALAGPAGVAGASISARMLIVAAASKAPAVQVEA